MSYAAEERNVFDVVDTWRNDAIMDTYDSSVEATESLARYQIKERVVFDVTMTDADTNKVRVNTFPNIDQANDEVTRLSAE